MEQLPLQLAQALDILSFQHEILGGKFQLHGVPCLVVW